MFGSRREEDQEELNKDVVISDRRARRKQKRGETFTRATETEQVDTEEDYEDGDEGDEEELPAGARTAPKNAPTPKQREARLIKEREARTRLERVPVLGNAVEYFQGVNAEVRKVAWPTREEAQRLTTIVLIVTVIASIALGAIDTFYGWWFRQGVEDTTTFLMVAGVVSVVVGFLYWWAFLRTEAQA